MIYKNFKIIILQEKGLTPLGGQVYKIRFSPQKLNKGKDTAERIIYADITNRSKIYLFMAFTKPEEANITKQELASIRKYASTL